MIAILLDTAQQHEKQELLCSNTPKIPYLRKWPGTGPLQPLSLTYWTKEKAIGEAFI